MLESGHRIEQLTAGVDPRVGTPLALVVPAAAEHEGGLLAGAGKDRGECHRLSQARAAGQAGRTPHGTESAGMGDGPRPRPGWRRQAS